MEYTILPSPRRTGVIQQQVYSLKDAPFTSAGQTAYNTGTGFWFGVVSGVAKFSIGNPNGSFMTWDGTSLTLSGAPLVREIIPSPEEITIPADFQMVLAENIEVSNGASLIVEGRLAIL